MDGRPNRRNKAAFSDFSGVVCTYLKLYCKYFGRLKFWMVLISGTFIFRHKTRPNVFADNVLALRFSVHEKHFQNGAFRKRWHHDNNVISLPEFCSNTNRK